MAGEIVKTEAICLMVRPFSRTSHVVGWLTPLGKISTSVKGAVRPKSAFLGQYDLNYTCEILYYLRARGDLHPLREATPLAPRTALRDDYRALAVADYYRTLADRLAPQGPECADWFRLLTTALDRLMISSRAHRLVELLRYELAVLHLLGLDPGIEAESGSFILRGERRLPVSHEVAAFFRDPTRPQSNPRVPLDASRAIGVYYDFHVDCAVDVRRTVLRMISDNNQEG